ncbi:MAG: hypothetical protein ACREMS_11270 [Gemmatimonadaceae bacterium]
MKKVRVMRRHLLSQEREILSPAAHTCGVECTRSLAFKRSREQAGYYKEGTESCAHDSLGREYWYDSASLRTVERSSSSGGV